MIALRIRTPRAQCGRELWRPPGHEHNNSTGCRVIRDNAWDLCTIPVLCTIFPIYPYSTYGVHTCFHSHSYWLVFSSLLSKSAAIGLLLHDTHHSVIGPITSDHRWCGGPAGLRKIEDGADWTVPYDLSLAGEFSHVYITRYHVIQSCDSTEYRGI